jgi:glycosyltransferase involved in cell wall biosynthesis
VSRARTAARLGLRSARDPLRWARIAAGSRGDGVRVFYGRDRMPGRDEPAYGGLVKIARLAETFPNDPRGFSVLYLGSSSRPHDSRQLIRLARRRGAAVVWNQDGVAYPGWAGPATDRINRPLAHGLHAADRVLFQSEFCRLSADRFLGERRSPSEVLHNPVDTAHFTPGERPREPVLLLGGNQYQRYRLETALETARLLGLRLLVTGRLSWSRDAEREGRELARGRDVELVGPYAYAGAPAVFRRATLLLHTKFNDPCPGLVLEAMACGLPVVYSASGGVPELVGTDAGIGVPAPLDFDRDHPPDPQELAAAVTRVLERLDDYSAAARERAARFDLAPWVERHRQLFEELVAR